MVEDQSLTPPDLGEEGGGCVIVQRRNCTSWTDEQAGHLSNGEAAWQDPRLLSRQACNPADVA